MPSGFRSESGAVEPFLAEFFRQVSDVRIDLHAGFRTDSWGAAEGLFAFRYTGQLPGQPAGAGQALAVRFATIFEFAGDQIQRSADYYDNTPLLAALGLLPALAGPSTPAATPTP